VISARIDHSRFLRRDRAEVETGLGALMRSMAVPHTLATSFARIRRHLARLPTKA